MAEHNELGKKGEEAAAKYLLGKQYRILDRNWRFGNDEIDIVAGKGSFVVFVEVKTRSNDWIMEPVVAVNKQKQRFLVRAANAYIEKNNCMLEARFDIISVLLTAQQASVTHIQDAFYPTL